MKEILKNKNEFFLALYLILFPILKIFTVNYTEKSTIILAITVTSLLIIWGISNICCDKKIFINCKLLLFIIIIYSIIFLDMLMRNNILKMEYIYNFTIYGVIPILLVSKVKNYEKLLTYYSALTIINGIMYLYDPLNSYKYTGNYMDFGFSYMLPAFVGSVILYSVYKKKYSLILMLIFFVEILIYANKGATICALCIILVYYIFLNKNKNKKYKRIVVILIISFIGFLNIEKIIDILLKKIQGLNISTYSLNTFLKILSGNGDAIYTSRTSIWEQAIHLIIKKPLNGYGLGYFEVMYNGYTHNLILDIAVAFGAIGLMMFLIVFIYSIGKVIRIEDYHKKTFLITMLVISVIPLMISLSYWKVMPFWIYLGIIVGKKK